MSVLTSAKFNSDLDVFTFEWAVVLPYSSREKEVGDFSTRLRVFYYKTRPIVKWMNVVLFSL